MWTSVANSPVASARTAVLEACLVKGTNDDARLFVGREFAPVGPHGGVFQGLMRFVQDGEHVARRSGTLDQRPMAFAHQRAAGFSAADELDYPGAAPALSAQGI